MNETQKQLSLSEIQRIGDTREKLQALLAYANKQYEIQSDGKGSVDKEAILKVYSQILGINLQVTTSRETTEKAFQDLGIDLEKEDDLVYRNRSMIEFLLGLG